ncbi:MAG: DUF2029 domain-containing protein [Armatimonadetes bacterium]|nr:DUF2029 domain-containing protein [Armatimonadota bacterium]
MSEVSPPGRSAAGLLLLAYALPAVAWSYIGPLWWLYEFNILAVVLVALAVIVAAWARPGHGRATPPLPELLLGFLVFQRVLQQLARHLWAGTGGLAWMTCPGFIYYRGFDQISTYDAEQLAFFFLFAYLAWKGVRWSCRAALAVLALMAWQTMYTGIALHPRPFIDVWDVLQQGASGLLHGVDPYAATFTTCYPSSARPELGYHSVWYVYGPGTLLPTVAGLLFGDVRWGLALCSAVAAGFAAALPFTAGERIERSAAYRLAALTAAAMLLAPEAASIWAWSFTEPALVLWLAVLAWAWRTDRRVLAGVCFGLLLATKQYTVLFLPPVLCLTRDRRFWVAAGVALVAVVLPFVLWNPGEFYGDTVKYLSQIPGRTDCVSFPALTARFGWLLPGWLALPPIPIGWWLACRRRPFGLADCLQWCGIVLCAELLFAKAAFRNYYHVVGVLWLLAAVVAWLEAVDAGEPFRPPLPPGEGGGEGRP